MSNTRLIYVSKQTAEVSNDKEGSFTNKVDDGVVVKVGDEINVEAIAINSVGVGAEIIEIPKRIKNYPYKTNSMVLNCAYYIHHNGHPFTCMLPLSTHNSVFSTIADTNYGYMDGTQTGWKILPFSSVKSKWGVQNQQLGQRFYLGSYVFAKGADPAKPIQNPLGIGQTTGAVPTIGIFEFYKTNLRFEVDTGYDNPANIANKITQDFHAGNVSPYVSIWNAGTNLPSYAFPIDASIPTPAGVLSIQGNVKTKDTACINVLSYPPNYNDVNTYSMYQSTMAFQNPYLHYYGSRILNPFVNMVEHLTENAFAYINQTIGGNPVVHLNDMYQLATLDNTAGNTTHPNNGIYIVSKLWNFNTLKIFADLIHSQKQTPPNMIGRTGDISTQPLLRQQQFSSFNIGRVDDASPAGTINTLDPPTMTASTAETSERLTLPTYYNAERWNKGILPADAVSGGMSIQYDLITTDDNGNTYSVQEICNKLDIMVVPIDTGVNGSNEIAIGFLTNNLDVAGTLFLKFNYAMIDLGFLNRNNPVALVLADAVNIGGSASTLSDYQDNIQIGSPNINLLFDETRGRFAMENMSWSNYIDNGTSTNANPSAGQPAIHINYLPPTDYGYSITPQSNAFTKFAQSGIGILDLSVIDDDDNVILINYEDEEDVKAKFSNSLLERLGFTYRQLTNRDGKIDAVFTQRCYETNRPISGVSQFPYPLTNNLRFDTTIGLGLSQNNNNLPMFNLNNARGFTNQVSSVSDRCYALGLPKKLENPFWLIKSDIIDGIDFNSENGGKNQNIVAVCNRAYLAGDFAFSFSTSYAFKATKEFVLSGVKTSILNPDLTPADINDATTIIYKVVSPIPFFQQQEEAELKQQKDKKK